MALQINTGEGPRGFNKPATESFTGKGDFSSKRKSIQIVLEMHGLRRLENLKLLGQEEIEQIRREIDYFQSHSEITPEQLESYYRDGAEVRNSFADLIGEKGRDALKEIDSGLPKTRVQ